MKPISESDEVLLKDAFPLHAKSLAMLRDKHCRLHELCHDYLLLRRKLDLEMERPEPVDQGYVTDLTEGLVDLRQEIEKQLRRMGVGGAPAGKSAHGKDET